MKCLFQVDNYVKYVKFTDMEGVGTFRVGT